MKICPSCGHKNAVDRDFCKCGEYLRWEPTQHVRALAPERAIDAARRIRGSERESAHSAARKPTSNRRVTAPRDGLHAAPGDHAGDHAAGAPPATGSVQPASDPAQSAILLLRPPDGDSASTDVAITSVMPGDRTTLVGVIRNESGIVDNYDLSVRGLPDGWWTITPATAYLVPYGTGDAYEQEIEVHLHPPRTPEALAQPWPFEVVATSRAHGAPVASSSAVVHIEPYQDVVAKLAPDRSSGRLKARFLLTLRNRSNAPSEVLLSAEDAERECRFRFAEPSVMIDPGRGVEAPFTVFPRKQIWLGRPKDRPIRVLATPAGLDESYTQLTATFRQRPWLPWWLAVAAPLAVALAAAVLLLLPKQVIVPNFKQAKSIFAAEKLALKAGLKLSPEVGQVQSSTAPPGAIVQQYPAVGEKVKRGTAVTVAVALGANRTKVPDVAGATPVAADGVLRRAHLVLGAVSPAPPNPNGTIGTQIPSAGSQVAPGTPVAVFLKPPSSGQGTGGNPSSAKQNRPGRSTKAIAIPVVAGTVSAAADQLSKLGFLPMTVEQFSRTQPDGKLIGTQPAAGATLRPGATVQLIVSAGFPALSYDSGGKVHVVSGATGKPQGTSPSANNADEASWSPDGTRLVFIQGAQDAGQIMSITVKSQNAKPVPLTAPDSNVRDPALAPNGKVMAFIDRSKGYGRLCFATVGNAAPINTSNCTGNSGYDLGRQISWSADGQHILVFGSKKANPSEHGMIEFDATVPFSPNASFWDQGNRVTQPAQDVIAGVFAPDGKSVALASDFGGSGFHVFLAPVGVWDVSSPKVKVLANLACQVSWRSDSKGLAVMQSPTGCAPDANGVYPQGNIVTFDLNDPDNEHIVASGAENPAWQPSSLGG